MGIAFHKIDRMLSRGLLAPGSRVLDIGSSNLYSAAQGPIRNFLAGYGASLDDAEVDRLAIGSRANGTFIGELFEAAGLNYLSFDIANGFRTKIFDLNKSRQPAEMRGTFDLVMNYGTTEHVINQLNAFEVIHDAAKVGGHMIHELPTSGYIDHGYFCYTPRFLFDLAGHNEYEVAEFTYQGPVDGNDIYGIIRDYASYFPALNNNLPEHRNDLWSRLKRRLKKDSEEIRPDNISIYLVLRKVKDMPFRLPNDGSTSVHVEESASPSSASPARTCP